jgi:hypothetical protein
MPPIELPEYRNIPGMEAFKFADKTLGDVISGLIPLIFVGAGLLLFLYLIIGGFELLTSAGNPKSVESAKNKITNAIIGFLIIFVAYWLTQILETILGISILVPRPTGTI